MFSAEEYLAILTPGCGRRMFHHDVTLLLSQKKKKLREVASVLLGSELQPSGKTVDLKNC